MPHVRDAVVALGWAFHVAYATQAQEAFLDGHVRAFTHFGGVPAVGRYDNMKPAVVRVMKGRDRTETERFITCRSHYPLTEPTGASSLVSVGVSRWVQVPTGC